MSPRRWLPAAAAVVLAACGPEDASTPTTAPSTVASIAGEVTAPPILVAPDTVDPDADADLTGDIEPAAVIRDGSPLVPGQRYVTTEVAPTVLDVSFEAPTAAATFGSEVTGWVYVAGDEGLTESVVSVAHLALLSVFSDPRVDFTELTVGADLSTLVEPAPADYLGWFAGQPGVTGGEVTTTEIAGFPARRMSYRIADDVPGALPCVPGDPRGCLASFTNPYAGASTTDFEGDAGVLYAVDVEGQPILVVEADGRAGAPEIVASLRFTVATTAADPTARPARGASELVAGTRYFWAGSALGVYRFDGVADVRADTVMSTNEAWLQIRGVQDGPCFMISHGRASSWVGTRLGDESGPNDPLDATVLEKIVGSPLITVVSPPRSLQLGAVTATAVDVRPARPAEGGSEDADDLVVLVAPGLFLESDMTSRIVVVPSPSGAPDVVMAILGSRCEELLDQLVVS